MLANLPQVASVKFSGSKSDKDKITEDLKAIKSLSELSALNIECIKTQPEFAIKVASSQEMKIFAQGASSSDFIFISSPLVDSVPEVRNGIMRHELVHANLRINNKNKCEQSKSGKPYCTETEKIALQKHTLILVKK